MSMLTGKEYLDSITTAVRDEIETELQRLQYFLKMNARARNDKYPFQFLVRNCRLEVINALAAHLEINGWAVSCNKDYIYISPGATTQKQQSTLGTVRAATPTPPPFNPPVAIATGSSGKL